MKKDTGHRGLAVATGLILALPLSLFVYFGECADKAMDKSGLGDLATWRVYQAKAGVALWATVAVWSLFLLIVALRPSFRATANLGCAVVLVIGAVGLLALFVI